MGLETIHEEEEKASVEGEGGVEIPSIGSSACQVGSMGISIHLAMQEELKAGLPGHKVSVGNNAVYRVRRCRKKQGHTAKVLDL
jgi:hypothetical protein